MTAEAVKKTTDGELEKLIKDEEGKLRAAAENLALARTEKREREQKRHDDALAEIMRLAEQNGVDLNGLFKGNGHKKSKRSFKAGEQYAHPEDPSKIWTVGSGRPPMWIDRG